MGIAASAELEFDHVWIVVTRDAPEGAALERAGLKISPDVNCHDGEGSASITAEFFNAYLELMWPDPTVSVAPGAERAVEKFNNRMNWRISGWCPDWHWAASLRSRFAFAISDVDHRS